MDPLKIALGVIVRHGLTLLAGLLAAIGMTKEETDQFLNAETTAAIVLALISFGSSYFTRAFSKLKQKLALEMPSGTSPQTLKEVAKEQPLSAKISTEPQP